MASSAPELSARAQEIVTAARELLEAEGPLRLLDPPRIDRTAVVRMAMASAASRETSEGLGSA